MKKFINAVLAGALGLSVIAGVSAQQPPAEVIVTENANGNVTPLIVQAPNFGTVNYSVEDQTITNPEDGDDTLVLQVTDNRGNSDGWIVGIYGSDFSNEEGSNSFAVSNLSLGSADVSANPGDADVVAPAPDLQMSGETTEIVSAADDFGSNGVFDVTYTGNQLRIPGGTPVDTYTSTLTVELTSAP